MAKLKDLLKLFNDQINSNELSALLSASDPNEAEISDEGWEEIKSQVEGLLTVESAQTNKDVKKALYKLHEKTIKTDLEDKLASIAEKIEAKDGYKSAKTIEDKIEFLTTELDNIQKPDSSEDTKTLKKYKQDIAELNDQISKLTEDSEKQITETKTQYEQKLEKKAFHQYLSNNFKLADAYQKPEIKQALFDKAYQEAKKSATIKLNEDDSFQVFDPETPEKPLYIKNKPAGINDIVSPHLQDYIQVSDPKPSDNPKPSGDSEPKSVHQPGTFGEAMANRRREYLSEMSK